MRPATGGYPTVIRPQAAVPPAAPPRAPAAASSVGGVVVALAVDATCCVAMFVGCLALAAAIATGRGEDGLDVVVGRLGWLHLVLAAAVPVAYWLGSQLFSGRTLGRILTGHPAERAGGRGAVRLLVPAVATTAVLGGFVGVTAPVFADPIPLSRPITTSSTGTTSTWSSASSSAESSTPTWSPTPSPTTDARTQAIGLDTLLNASRSSRTSLRAALNDAERCVNAAAAANTLQRVTDERSGQLTRARELPVDLVPNGATIRALLVEALTYSVAADQAFTAWAANVAAGRCGHDGNYAEAGRASSSATVAKRNFCAAWNPVAPGFGLPTRTEDEV